MSVRYGPFDETRYIRHHESRSILEINNAEDRLQRREMVIGNLRFSITHHGKKRRLTDIRESDKADVCDAFELKKKLDLPGGLTGLRILGRLHRAGRIVLVSLSAVAALQKSIGKCIAGHVDDDLPCRRIAYDRSLRNLEDKVLTALAGLAPSAAFLAVSGMEFAGMAKILQRIESLIDDKNHAAAVSSVAAVRAARRNKFLSPEGDMAVAALAACDIYSSFIRKCHSKSS